MKRPILIASVKSDHQIKMKLQDDTETQQWTICIGALFPGHCAENSYNLEYFLPIRMKENYFDALAGNNSSNIFAKETLIKTRLCIFIYVRLLVKFIYVYEIMNKAIVKYIKIARLIFDSPEYLRHLFMHDTLSKQTIQEMYNFWFTSVQTRSISRSK